MNNQRLKVLIIAHEFAPTRGSECAVGWNIVTRLAKYHNVTVLYASGSQESPNSYVELINNYIASHGAIEGLNLVNIDQPHITKFITTINRSFFSLGHIGLPLLYYSGYKFWQKSAFNNAIKLHRTENFDVVHQLTQISFRVPGYWWKLGIPFFWGPIGGLQSLPKQFYDLLSAKIRLMEIIRKFSNFYHYKFSKRVIESNKRAKVIYSFSNEDAALFAKRASGTMKLMLDVGTSNNRDSKSNELKNSSIATGIWCGHLIERKAAIILLKALSLSKVTKEEIKFQIIGSGPLESKLHEQSKMLGLSNVEWIGNVDHHTVFTLMNNADFFVHTSLREATSSVIPEALSMGLPVICHDSSGMSIAINDSCGIKIPLSTPETSIKGFHNAIEKLVLDKQLNTQLKTGARKRSLELSWDIMAETIANDYTEVVNNGIEKMQ